MNIVMFLTLEHNHRVFFLCVCVCVTAGGKKQGAQIWARTDPPSHHDKNRGMSLSRAGELSVARAAGSDAGGDMQRFLVKYAFPETTLVVSP